MNMIREFFRVFFS